MSNSQIKQIESDPVRSIAEYLFDKQISITYFGKAWSGCTNNWIYFDTCLDIEALIVKFKLDDNIEVHENLDPKSGMERGFIDNSTGEAIMGKIN